MEKRNEGNDMFINYRRKVQAETCGAAQQSGIDKPAQQSPKSQQASVTVCLLCTIFVSDTTYHQQVVAQTGKHSWTNVR